uniref:Uncharacterized protein n=1 Tax=Anopheles albimanus TaxID=7167 RepID=A0A182FLB0_ANOAL
MNDEISTHYSTDCSHYKRALLEAALTAALKWWCRGNHRGKNHHHRPSGKPPATTGWVAFGGTFSWFRHFTISNNITTTTNIVQSVPCNP